MIATQLHPVYFWGFFWHSVLHSLTNPRKKPAPKAKCGYSVEEGWLGGLDSNQDNQIQSLMYYQLYDLPTEGVRDSLQHPEK